MFCPAPPLKRDSNLSTWKDHERGPTRGPRCGWLRLLLADEQSCPGSKGKCRGEKPHNPGHSCPHLETSRAVVDPGAPQALICNIGASKGGRANTQTSWSLGLRRLRLLAFPPARRISSQPPSLPTYHPLPQHSFSAFPLFAPRLPGGGKGIPRQGRDRLTPRDHELQLLQPTVLKNKGHPSSPVFLVPASTEPGEEPGLSKGGL